VQKERGKVIPKLRQIPYKTLQRLLREAVRHPVERRTQVVHQLLPRILLPDRVREAGCRLDVWIARLDPQQVGVGGELQGALGGGGDAGAVVVEAFAGARAVPVEGDGGGCVLGGEVAAGEEGEVGGGGDGGFVGGDFGWGDAFFEEVGFDS